MSEFTPDEVKSVVLNSRKFEGADLRDIDLRGADLMFANLRQADLSGANLRSIDEGATIYAEIVFSALFVGRALGESG